MPASFNLARDTCARHALALVRGPCAIAELVVAKKL